MSPLCKKPIHMKQIILDQLIPSLTLWKNSELIRLARVIYIIFDIKEIPLHICCRKGTQKKLQNADQVAAVGDCLPAGMTVEAAVVIPLLLFFFLNLMSSVEMLRLHGKLAASLWENGRIMAVGGYLCETGKEDEIEEGVLAEFGTSLLTDWVVKEVLVHELGEEYLYHSPLTYGENGLNLVESSYMEDDCIDIKVTYKVSPMFAIPGFSSFRMANRYYARAWTGYKVWEEKVSESGEWVYVAEYGQVYHRNRFCSYLVRKIEEVSIGEIQNLRNSQGKRYALCLQCEAKKEISDMWQKVYVTADGEKYHYLTDCSALKRTVRTIPQTEAEGRYPPCSKCAA